MRSPGIIYRRYRQLKKKLLYQKLLQSRKKTHDNCHYSHGFIYTNPDGITRTVRLCLYNSLQSKDIRSLDICNNPFECTAFACKKSKEEVAIEFEMDLLNPSIKQYRYPELSLIEWVLDKNLNDAIKEPSFIGKSILFIITVLEKMLINLR